MKITNISVQAKNKNRVNISVDEKYRFSLDVYQIGELGIKIGKEYTDAELTELETESQFGKLYTRSLEYCLMRPHSSREMQDYLWRKTQTSKYKTRQGEIKDREGVSQAVADRVYTRLISKGYIDDEKFTRFWVENRNQSKGSSRRKLINELRLKGVDMAIIERTLSESTRSDETEIEKIIAKKRTKYPDEQKFMRYLAGQGFSYDAIKHAIEQKD